MSKVNSYGICHCRQCASVRKRGKTKWLKQSIRSKIIKRLRKPFGNKEPQKGFYLA